MLAAQDDADALSWKLKRLRTMGVAEIFYRVVRAARVRMEAAGIARIAIARPQAGVRTCTWMPGRPGSVDAQDILERAQAVLAGRFDVFAMRGAELGFPPEWNRDPRTGILAPMSFGKRLNYRDASLVGDIKYLWEPSRHLELVTLAQAFEVSRDRRYADGARTLLDSWFDQCPFPCGVHWTSSLELAVRLINWSVAWQLLESTSWLAEPEQAALRDRWLGEVFRHQAFIAGHLSRHSSANNHLFGEYAGLLIGSTTWPLWSASREWQRQARAGLEREALLQNAPDGVNREQALWYHHEVADMMLLAGLAARAAGLEFSPAYWQRLQDMLAYVASLMSSSGRLPMIGDSDDAVMVRFSGSSDFDVYRSLLATGAVLFERSDFALKARRFDDKSRWLLGASAEATFKDLRARATAADFGALPARRAFEHGGYWVLGDSLDKVQEVRIIADAGPLGYLSIAAHGHADALSITLSSDGRELLVDPGTYAYHTQHEWRRYFRGTSAHNTVRVDGLDQSVSGGNFMWLRHANAKILRVESNSARDEWVASHDGYTRLADPLIHTRNVIYEKGPRELLVTDEFDCREAHDVELFWHFAEECDVRRHGAGLVVVTGPISMRVRLPERAGKVEVVRGRDSPPLGWVSRRFDEKVPTYTVVWSGQIYGPSSLVTRFTLGP